MATHNHRALLDVRDLSVVFAGGAAIAADHVSFRIGKGETVALVGESGSGKTVSALSILRLLPYPSASHPSGEIWFEGRNMLKLSEKQLQQVRGNRISMIFQEPMTSLNPAAHDRAAGRRGAAPAQAHGRQIGARARAGAAAQGRHPRPRATARRLPAPAVGRAAPARDDRHGARQRAGPAHRRRADDGARRHHPGADPRTIEAAAARDGHGPAAHHPRPRHRAQDG